MEFFALIVAGFSTFPLVWILWRLKKSDAGSLLTTSWRLEVIIICLLIFITLVLGLEVFFGVRLFGVLARFFADEYPAILPAKARIPVLFLLTTTLTSVFVFGLSGLIIRRKLTVSLTYALVSFVAFVFIWQLISGDQRDGPDNKIGVLPWIMFYEDGLGRNWLGDHAHPLQFVARAAPILFGVVAGVFTTLIVITRRRTKIDGFPFKASHNRITVIGFVFWIIVLMLAARVVFTESMDAEGSHLSSITKIQESLPDDFLISEVTPPEIFINPTTLAVRDDGRVFVSSGDGIYSLFIEPSTGQHADLKKFSDTSGATGLYFYDGRLLVASNGTTLAMFDKDGDDRADSQQVIVEGLPGRIYSYHSNNGLLVDSQDRLLMTVGGTSDHGPESYELGGTIVMTTPDGGVPKVWARGLRNPYGIAECPNGDIYVNDNGPDQVEGLSGVNFPTNNQLLYFASDEVNRVLQDRNYGYPTTFGFPGPGDSTEAPVALLPERAGSAGVECYSSESFPIEYYGDLFVALFGTLVDNDGFESGKQIVRIDLDAYESVQQPQISTFAGEFGHPVDVKQYVDGSLLVLDYEIGQLLRIAYISD